MDDIHGQRQTACEMAVADLLRQGVAHFFVVVVKGPEHIDVFALEIQLRQQGLHRVSDGAPPHRNAQNHLLVTVDIRYFRDKWRQDALFLLGFRHVPRCPHIAVVDGFRLDFVGVGAGHFGQPLGDAVHCAGVGVVNNQSFAHGFVSCRGGAVCRSGVDAECC